MPGQLRQCRRRATEADVDQLHQRVFLYRCELHWSCSTRAVDSAPRISALSNGLLTKAFAPACFGKLSRRRLNVGGHDDDPRLSVEFTQLCQHVQPVHPAHHEIEHDHVRFLEKIALQRNEAILGFDHLASGSFQNLPEAAARESRIVDDQHSGRHMRSRIAAVNRSSRTASSLSPASTTDRGIPYTMHVSSASVSTAPPRALIQAAPSRPSAPIPVITTAKTRSPKTSAAD